RYYRPACRSRRRSFGRCRVGPSQASVADPESVQECHQHGATTLSASYREINWLSAGRVLAKDRVVERGTGNFTPDLDLYPHEPVRLFYLQERLQPVPEIFRNGCYRFLKMEKRGERI